MSDVVQHSDGPIAPQNGMGVAALVLGIVGLVFCLGYSIILPLLAVIFGAIGRKKADQGLANNKGMATAGFVMGIIGLAIGSTWIILSLIGALTTPFMGNA